ncbi:cysteine desulfurase family protein [Paenibacillus hexagrammi]|nr:cysteine desulfurase family protein [Paenibacillus sp. YPD9-1]
MLYLDYAATTPPYEDVITAVAEVMSTYYGNPSSIHGLGVQAERLLQQAKESMAQLLKVSAEELICTSCGTESNNLAIKGAAYQYRHRGNHLITTQIEHPSVLGVFRQLEAEGFRVTYLPVDSAGTISMDSLVEALCEETIVVSTMFVNNETGAVQPIAEIGRYLKAYPRIIYHVDAVQGMTKLPISLGEWGIDLCSISAHKFRGPKGAGLLFCRKRDPAPALVSWRRPRTRLAIGYGKSSSHRRYG